LKQLLVDAGTEEPVSREDITRGYEAGRREYIEVTDEELEKIQIESTHAIDTSLSGPMCSILPTGRTSFSCRLHGWN
jgi:non-homologous end joining protein Ku